MMNLIAAASDSLEKLIVDIVVQYDYNSQTLFMADYVEPSNFGEGEIECSI